jgi:carboxyl-terminal processing protease
MDIRTTPKHSTGTARYAGILLLLLAVFFAGSYTGSNGFFGLVSPATAARIAPTPAPTTVDLTPVWTAWRIIDQKFVPTGVAAEALKATTTGSTTARTGANDDQQRVWGMVQGLAMSLQDPYTVFMPPTEKKMFEEEISGAFEGVGMEIATKDNILTVVSPLKNSPAYDAGVKAGDRIISVDGVPMRGVDSSQAVKKIRGPKGTTVSLLIDRDESSVPITIKIVRNTITIPTIETKMRDDGVFVIALYNFYAQAPAEFRKAITEFKNSSSHHLVIDLRGNPGGYLAAAVEIGSYFIPANKTIVTEDYATKQASVSHTSLGFDFLSNKSFKTTVLIDKGSASASEILADALRFYGTATIVGTNSFGKGSVQELVSVTPDTNLKITVARWLGPDGTQIPLTGIVPDVFASSTAAQIKKGSDPALEKAVELLLKK